MIDPSFILESAGVLFAGHGHEMRNLISARRYFSLPLLNLKSLEYGNLISTMLYIINTIDSIKLLGLSIPVKALSAL